MVQNPLQDRQLSLRCKIQERVRAQPCVVQLGIEPDHRIGLVVESLEERAFVGGKL